MRSNDQTLVSQYIQDRDRKVPEHELACQYVATNFDIAKSFAIRCLGGESFQPKTFVDESTDSPEFFDVQSDSDDFLKIDFKNIEERFQKGALSKKDRDVKRRECRKEYENVLAGFRIDSVRLAADSGFRATSRLSPVVAKGEGKYRSHVGFLDIELTFGASHVEWHSGADVYLLFTAGVEVKTTKTLIKPPNGGYPWL